MVVADDHRSNNSAAVGSVIFPFVNKDGSRRRRRRGGGGGSNHPISSSINNHDVAKNKNFKNSFSFWNKGRIRTISSIVVFLIGSFYIVITIYSISSISDYNSNSQQQQQQQQLRRRRHSSISAFTTNGRKQLQLRQDDINFPIHAGHDSEGTEQIPHPGIVFSGAERIAVLMPDLDFPETLTVPKFWNPSATIDNGDTAIGVREYLGNYGQRLIEPEEAAQIGSWWKQQEENIDDEDEEETIFVSIASYRDTECRPTVESLFLRAQYPNRIRVAIVDQIEDGDQKCSEPQIPCDEDPNQPLCKYKHLIDVYEVKAYLMVGPVFARHIAHRMYCGEYFVLQVDAHVRFVQNWDEDIINQWYATGNEMAVLSTYLTDIANSIDPITHKSLREERNILCKIQYDGTGKNSRLVLKAPLNGEPTIDTPQLHPFWSAGFSFSRGHFLVQVPYDQHLPMLFQGEESSIAIRGFTYGYDFYAPVRSIAFHIYAVKSNIGRRNRHKFWENDTLYMGALDKSTARLNGITGLISGQQSNKEYYRVDEKKYGLGQVRTKETYFEMFGVDTNAQHVDESLCGFVKGTMHKEFTKYLRKNGMGIDYNLIPKNLK